VDILILGGTGMLGHALWYGLRERHTITATVRADLETLRRRCALFCLGGVQFVQLRDVLDLGALRATVERSSPEVVINAVGIVKQLPDAKNPVQSISINALFPHLLARECCRVGARLIQISTDCVFSGRKGGYTEADLPDPEDLYGRTKLLGEVEGLHSLTLRTSLVGRELRGAKGLLEWFLSQRGQVSGFRRAVFSGLTTYAFTQIIRSVIEDCPAFEGIYHVSSEPISKYHLLCRLKEALGLATDVVPDDAVVVNRSLNSTRFWNVTGLKAPGWDEMIAELARIVTAYAAWRF